MKTYIFIILAVLIFSYATTAQTKKPKKQITKPTPIKAKKTLEAIRADISSLKNARDYSANYDKFDNFTTVFCKIDATLFALFSFKGEVLTITSNDFLIRADSFNSKDKFSTNNRLQLILDDERLEFDRGEYHIIYDDKNRENRELLLFRINRKTLQRIIDAKKVEYRVGTYESYLTGSEREKLKILLTLATPY